MKAFFYSVYLVTVSVLFGACSTSVEEGDSNTADTEMSTHTVSIDATTPVAPIQPTMYGIFFEDINFAADGGIYAEMIKNRSFEFELPLIGWEQPNSDRFSMNENSGFASVHERAGEEANAHYLKVKTQAEQGYTLTNSGFRGMGIKEGNRYFFSTDARVQEGNPALKIQLVDTAGNILATTDIRPEGKEWRTYNDTLTATASELKAQFRILFEGTAVVDLDMISLFPEDTWMDRPRGMREDLVQMLADLDPGFLRFPGGCIVEGRNLARRYQWKKTIGDIDEREVLVNRWNTEFRHRLTPDYYQSFGLGFFEYFQLSEDLGAEPLPILSCGIACQFNTGEMVPMDELQPYIDDALDLIEFANGPTDSEWGSIRAEMGHPEPFNMKYIGIGNEQWGPEYIRRYKEFDKAIKEAYPDMIIVSGSGPFPDGEMFEYGMRELKEMDAELIDEHYYRPPEWFRENADRYDSYDRNGPKIFAGEYAAQSVAIASPDNENNWNCALSEAAFMTGLERNAEVVHLTSYAPLFAHADGWQWTPDLIWFNNLEVYGTPNYYVQKLFSTNRGTHVLHTAENGSPLTGQNGLYGTAALDSGRNQLIIKLVNTSEGAKRVTLEADGVDWPSSAEVTELKSDDPSAVNSFEAPENIFPETSDISIDGGEPVVELAPASLTIIRIDRG